MYKNMLKRAILSLSGVLIISFAVALFRKANLGTDTFSCMNLGLSNLLNQSFGNVQLVVNILLFIPLILWGRKYIGLGTIFNMVLVGYVSDFCMSTFLAGNEPTFLIRLVLLFVGLIICCFGVATTCAANFGLSPYDALAFIIEDLIHGKLPYDKLRIIQDVTFLLTGFLLGSTVGIGTIAFALCSGPAVNFFKNRMNKWYKL